MGAVCSAVQCWLAKGASMASDALDGIWATVTSMFEAVCELVRRLFESLWFCGSYEKETSWKETTAEGRAEQGHTRVHVQGGFNATPAGPASTQLTLPSDPIERKRVRDKMKKEIGLAMTSLETLTRIMDEDEEHDNMLETEAKLKDFESSPEGRALREFINKQQTVNPSLN